MSFQARTIVLEEAAREAADTAAAQHQRFEEAFDGLQWLLARDPNQGLRGRIDDVDVNIYVQDSDPTANTPEIWVVFSHDPDKVTIYAIQVSSPDPA